MRPLLLGLFFFLFIFSCKEGKKYPELSGFGNIKIFEDSDFENTTHLTSTFRKNVSSKINYIDVADSLIVLSLASNDAPIHILNINMEDLAVGGRHGSGVGEQLVFYSALFDNDIKSFWTTDIVTKKITNYNLASFVADPKGYMPEIQVDFKNHNVEIYSPIYLNGRFIGPLLTGTDRLAFTDFLVENIQYGGIMPLKRKKNTPDEVNANAYYGIFTGKAYDSTSLLIKVNMFSPLVELYTDNGDELITLFGPEKFSPKYRILKKDGYPVFSPAKDVKIGFMDAFIRPNRIYLLYSGKIADQRERGNEVFCNTVYVFDWEGRPLKKYTLDEGVTQIAIDKDETFLWGGSRGTLIRYEL